MVIMPRQKKARTKARMRLKKKTKKDGVSTDKKKILLKKTKSRLKKKNLISKNAVGVGKSKAVQLSKKKQHISR